MPLLSAWEQQTNASPSETEHGFHLGEPIQDLEAEFLIQLGTIPNAALIAAALVATVREFMDGTEMNGNTRPSEADTERLARLSSAFIASENIELDCRALALVSGIGTAIGLGSAAAVAREIGLSRAAVTKRANQLSDLLEFRPLKFMRSQQTRENCAKAQRQDHWRKRL